MRDFVYFNPTRIIFGRGRESEIGSELAAAGIRKVLFIYGQQSIVKSGLFDRIAASLIRASVAYVAYGGVSSNPVLSHTRQGVAVAKAESVDAILAVGGGSVLDEAKAIAVGALSAEDVWQFFVGQPVSAALPVFTVLTLAATGSEMNGNSVITNEATRQKYNISSPHIYPRLSILNPELTCSVPADYTAYGAVDAIAHVIEAYFTSEYRPGLQNRQVENIIKTVISATDIILRNPNDVEARAEFMWAATLALNGLTTSGVGRYAFPNHMIEHSLSALYNIAHGAGLSIIIPAWMKWYAVRNPAQFTRFAQEIFGVSSPMVGISQLEGWFSAIGAPIRLADAGIPADDIRNIADNAHALATLWGINKVYTRDAIVEILSLASC